MLYRAAVLLIVGTCFLASSAFAAKIEVEGAIPRNFADAQFDVTITISEVTSEEKARGENDSGAKDRIEIKVENDSDPLPFEGDVGFQDDSNDYYIEDLETNINTDPNVADQWQYEIKLRIHDNKNGDNLERDAGEDNQLVMEVSFFLGGEEADIIVTKENNVLTRDLYVATQEPTFDADLKGVYEGLKIDFTERTEISTSDDGTTSTQRAASTLNLVIVDLAIVTSDTELMAKTFSGDINVPDTETTCDFVIANIDGGQCISCPGQTYLEIGSVDQQPGFRVTKAAASSSTKTVRGLENRTAEEGQYAVFMQYDPTGVEQSECRIGLPAKDTTLTEYNGGGEAKDIDFRCFVATAAYGTALHGDLDLFRAFRDRVLLQFSAGEWLVHRYYENSPPVADWIAETPWAKTASRWILSIPAFVLDIFYDDNEQS